MLLDLIETRGDKGKWFAAAKDSGFFDIAVGYAASHTVDTRHRYAFSVALQAATPDPRLVAKRFELRRLEFRQCRPIAFFKRKPGDCWAKVLTAENIPPLKVLEKTQTGFAQ